MEEKVHTTVAAVTVEEDEAEPDGTEEVDPLLITSTVPSRRKVKVSAKNWAHKSSPTRRKEQRTNCVRH